MWRLLTAATGQLRFKPPVPKALDKLAAINATRPGPACMQQSSPSNKLASTYGLSEDCLTLQVLTPPKAAGTNGSLPVMVYS